MSPALPAGRLDMRYSVQICKKKLSVLEIEPGSKNIGNVLEAQHHQCDVYRLATLDQWQKLHIINILLLFAIFSLYYLLLGRASIIL